MNDLHYQIHPGHGPYLLLVHGMLSSSSQWRANISALGSVCRPITVDLWGHADSPSPRKKEHYQPGYYAQRFDNIRKHVKTNKWFVCGSSLGAGLTIRYAIDFPAHVYGQIFTNSNSGFASKAITHQWRRNAISSFDQILQGGRESLSRMSVHPRHARRIPQPIKDLLVEDAKRHDAYGIAMTTRYTVPYVSVVYKLPHNRVPSLLLCGRFEKRFQASREFVQRRMPNLSIVDIDAGHAVNMQDADNFNCHAERFIAETMSSQRSTSCEAVDVE